MLFGGLVGYSSGVIVVRCHTDLNTSLTQNDQADEIFNQFISPFIGVAVNHTKLQDCYTDSSLIFDSKYWGNFNYCVGMLVGFLNNSIIDQSFVRGHLSIEVTRPEYGYFGYLVGRANMSII